MDDIKENLAQLVIRGGIYYDIPGSTRQDFLTAVIRNLPELPALKKEALLQAVMEREALISTAIENGIALPHPRTPMLEDSESPFVAIAFPLQPLDWDAPDGGKVHTVFLIVSKSPKQHLEALTKINFLCQQENFFSLISSRAAKDEINAAIFAAEKDWG